MHIYSKEFFMYKETKKHGFSENETLLDASESNIILQSLIYQNWANLNIDGAHTWNGYWISV